MATNAEEDFLGLMRKADEYHRAALWQEKLRSLQEALGICQEPEFPDGPLRRMQVLSEMGGIRRRFGQYSDGIEALNNALDAFTAASPIARARILGELGVMYRHCSEFDEARKAFQRQYQLVKDSADTSLEADAELCRAIGNEAMSCYNLATLQTPPDQVLLQIAVVQLEERVGRAYDLQCRIAAEDSGSRLADMSRTWEIIGLDRLSQVLVRTGATAEAVEAALRSQEKQRASSRDPTVTALSRFCYGHALWHNGQTQDAIEQWNIPDGTCSCAMAFCKEPAAEYVQYLKLVSDAGIDLDTRDEQGFSALDYATFSNTKEGDQSVRVIIEGLRRIFESQIVATEPSLSDKDVKVKVESKVALRVKQAKLRRAYRAILQEHIRPALSNDEVDAIPKLRATYAKILKQDPCLKEVFDDFHFIKYNDFRKLGRLPKSTDGLAIPFSDGTDGVSEVSKDQFIIFFSYRWLGGTEQPPSDGPDDTNRTQWRRMMNAIDEYVKRDPGVDLEKLGIWLDCACIDQNVQDRRERGIDALPLAVTQCNALISLVDELYYTRAWCTVEVILFRDLWESYHRHEWWEHRLMNPKIDRSQGILKRGVMSRSIDVSRLKVTKEELDRPNIDFLLRQSKLLRKDDF